MLNDYCEREQRNIINYFNVMDNAADRLNPFSQDIEWKMHYIMRELFECIYFSINIIQADLSAEAMVQNNDTYQHQYIQTIISYWIRNSKVQTNFFPICLFGIIKTYVPLSLTMCMSSRRHMFRLLPRRFYPCRVSIGMLRGHAFYVISVLQRNQLKQISNFLTTISR